MPKAAELVVKHGKRVMGWHEIADASLPAGSIVQYWGTDDDRAQELARKAAAQGAEVVMSPANRAYLDMKYDQDTPYGLDWAGLVSVEKSYSWDPATLIPDLPESAVIGVEAPLWSETLDDMAKVEFMAFPRLPGIAELGWSPASALDWTTYKDRLAGQGSRWDVLSVNFYRAPEIDWRLALQDPVEQPGCGLVQVLLGDGVVRGVRVRGVTHLQPVDVPVRLRTAGTQVGARPAPAPRPRAAPRPARRWCRARRGPSDRRNRRCGLL